VNRFLVSSLQGSSGRQSIDVSETPAECAWNGARSVNGPTMTERPWIARALGTEAFDRLAAELSGSELQSVLLEVMHRRAARRAPRDLMAQYEGDPFCSPAAVDQRTAVELDAHLLAAAEGFEAIELSPVAPLGACSVVALTDQKRVLSALRGTEVVSDPTNVLALECASRLRARQSESVHLATCQRVVRAQPVPEGRGHTQHFRLFVLASGGLEGPEHRFAVDAVVRQIRVALRALDRLEMHGYTFGERRVDILTTPEREALGVRVAQQLGALATRKALEHPYYSGGLRFQIWVTDPEGASIPLIDGGVFDWLAKLTSNRRAVYVATGAGSQLMALRFRRDAFSNSRG
jgi:hypothetical protein